MGVEEFVSKVSISSIKDINKLFPFEALIGYYKLGVSALPLGTTTVLVSSFKEYTKRSPTKEELEYFINNLRDMQGVAIVTGHKGLTAFDIDGKEAKEVFWNAFKTKFGKAPEELTWVERRIDPRDGSEHYHVYVKYVDYLNTSPVEGTKKIFTNDKGEEIAIIYNQWIRATPTFYEGSKYEWIHNDDVKEPLKLSPADFEEFVRLIDPYYTLSKRKDEVLSEEAKVLPPPDKELTDEQIEQVVELVAPRWPKPGAGRGLFILGLSGLLAYIGVVEESTIKVVKKIYDEVDEQKSLSKLREWISKVKSTYSRIKRGEPVAYRSWFRSLGMEEEEIDRFRDDIIKIVRPSVCEFFKRELEYVLGTSYKGGKIEVNGEKIECLVIRKKIIQPYKNGRLYLIEKELFFVNENTYRLYFKPSDQTETPEASEQSGTDEEDNQASKPKLVLVEVKIKKEDPVSQKEIEIIKTVFVGDDVYVELNVGNHKIVGSIKTVVDELVKIGIIRERYKDEFKSFLAWVSDNIPPEDVHKIPGIALNGKGEFIDVLPGKKDINLYPVNPLAVELTQRIDMWSKRVTASDYKEFLSAIVKYKDYLEKEIYYIAMSYMAISPFFDAIITIASVKPALVLTGPKGSGKSELAKFISVNAFGSEQLKQDIFQSAFREGAVLSASTFPVFIDDVDKWNQQTIGKLKATLTGTQRMIRGRPNQTFVIYEEKSSFVMTCNQNIFETEDPAFRDRLIILNFKQRIGQSKKIKFKKEIGFKVHIGHKVYAHHFVSDLVRVVNALGGYEWMQNRFITWMEEAADLGITDSRDPERFAILLLGAEILHYLLRSYGLEFDFNEAKKVITEYFRATEEAVSVPEKLVNVVYAISQMEPTGKIMYDKEKDAYIVGMQELKIMQEQYGKIGEFPKGPKELADLLVGSYEEITHVKQVYGCVKEADGKVRKVCFLPRSVYEHVLGVVEAEKISYSKDGHKTKRDEEPDQDVEKVEQVGQKGERKESKGLEEKQEVKDEKADVNVVSKTEEQKGNIQLDDMEKKIVETANFVMDTIPNPNYQVHEFIRQIKTKIGDNLLVVIEKLEKLLKDGVLQSHFNVALEKLKEELKSSKAESKELEEKQEKKDEGDEEVEDWVEEEFSKFEYVGEEFRWDEV